jgi:hypothetical protein
VPRWGSLGNAFLEIQAIAQPQMEHVLEARREAEDKVEQDDVGGPDQAGDAPPASPDAAPEPPSQQRFDAGVPADPV